MQNLSEIIGKPAYTSGGEYAGTVKNARLSKNLKKLRGFECFDEQEEEFELPVTAVASVGDALLIKSPSFWRTGKRSNCRAWRLFPMP